MARVLSVVTPITVVIVWRSESLLLGSTDAIASAGRCSADRDRTGGQYREVTWQLQSFGQ